MLPASALLVRVVVGTVVVGERRQQKEKYTVARKGTSFYPRAAVAYFEYPVLVLKGVEISITRPSFFILVHWVCALKATHLKVISKSCWVTCSIGMGEPETNPPQANQPTRTPEEQAGETRTCMRCGNVFPRDQTHFPHGSTWCSTCAPPDEEDD